MDDSNRVHSRRAGVAEGARQKRCLWLRSPPILLCSQVPLIAIAIYLSMLFYLKAMMQTRKPIRCGSVRRPKRNEAHRSPQSRVPLAAALLAAACLQPPACSRPQSRSAAKPHAAELCPACSCLLAPRASTRAQAHPCGHLLEPFALRVFNGWCLLHRPQAAGERDTAASPPSLGSRGRFS